VKLRHHADLRTYPSGAQVVIRSKLSDYENEYEKQLFPGTAVEIVMGTLDVISKTAVEYHEVITEDVNF